MGEATWSDELGRQLLAAISDEAPSGEWGQPGANTPAALLRDELLAWANTDADVRSWIARAWRQAHPDVVTAALHGLFPQLAAADLRAPLKT